MIDRTLVYGALTATPITVYFVVVLVLGLTVGGSDAEIRSVVGETVQPAHVSLWLRDGRS